MSSCPYRGIEGSGKSRMPIAVLEDENDTQEGRRERAAASTSAVRRVVGEHNADDAREIDVLRRLKQRKNTLPASTSSRSGTLTQERRETLKLKIFEAHLFVLLVRCFLKQDANLQNRSRTGPWRFRRYSWTGKQGGRRGR